MGAEQLHRGLLLHAAGFIDRRNNETSASVGNGSANRGETFSRSDNRNTIYLVEQKVEISASNSKEFENAECDVERLENNITIEIIVLNAYVRRNLII